MLKAIWLGSGGARCKTIFSEQKSYAFSVRAQKWSNNSVRSRSSSARKDTRRYYSCLEVRKQTMWTEGVEEVRKIKGDPQPPVLALHLHDPDSDCLRAGMRDRCGKSQERKNIPGGEHMQGIEIPGKQVNQLKWNRGFKLGRKG